MDRWSNAYRELRGWNGGQLYGYGRWPTIRIMEKWPTIRIMMVPNIRIGKVANYRDNEGGQLYGYGSGQLYGYGRWPTIRIWKVANYTDNEGGQL